MKRLLILILLVLSASLARAEEAHVLEVIDGDSLLVEVRGIRAEVRLLGIDAPEWSQEWGPQAKEFALAFCTRGPVDLEYGKERFDRYNRILAYVWKDGKMLNEELLANGLAVTYMLKKRDKYAAKLQADEERAKAARAGFWAQGGLAQQPREYRKASHANK